MLKHIIDKIKNMPYVVVMLICTTIIFISSYVPEAVGPANNGDFLRVIRPSKIDYIDNNPRTVWQDYGYTPDFYMDLGSGGGILGRAVYFIQTDFTVFNFPSSQILTIKLSKFLNFGFNILSGKPLNQYNLFWLFLIHVVIFSVAVYLILHFIYHTFGKNVFIFAAVIAIFVFSDQGYSFYFNSFYGEALQYVLTLLSIGLFLRLIEKRKGWLSLYFIAVYLMATSKFAWIPVGILFSLAPLVFLFVNDMEYCKKRLIMYSCFSVFALSVFYALLIPSWIENDTNFNAVFDGVLRGSETPEQDLEQLGLDPSFAVLQGWQMYLDDYPIDVYSNEFKESFYDKVNKSVILLFYLRNPNRFISILRESAYHARYIRAPYLTNVQDPTHAGQQAYRFSLWENIRVRIPILASLGFITSFLVGSTIYGFYKFYIEFKGKRDCKRIMLHVLLLTITASATISFILPYISNGDADQAKQLFGFINLFDMLIFTWVGFFYFKVHNAVKKYFPHIQKSLMI